MRCHNRACHAVVALALAASAFSTTASAEDLYVKRADWQDTCLQTRARYLEWRATQGGTDPVEFGPWYATHPIKAKNFKEKLFPEKRVDFSQKGRDGKPLWYDAAKYEDGKVHYLPRKEWACTYLAREITARAPMDLGISIGSDDGCAIWLGGKPVLVRDVPRGVSADQDKATLKLEKGTHTLLFKIHNRTGNHGFYFATAQGGASAADSVWNLIERDFPTETAWFREDASTGGMLSWLRSAASVKTEKRVIAKALGSLSQSGARMRGDLRRLETTGVTGADRRWLDLYVKVCGVRQRMRDARSQLALINVDAVRRTIRDLAGAFPDRYTRGREFLAKLDELEKEVDGLAQGLARGDDASLSAAGELLELKRTALLANPLLDFDRLLLIKRSTHRLGLPQNWQGNCAISKTGYDNEIVTLSPVRPGGALRTFFEPENNRFVGDLDLDFDAGRMMVSMQGDHGRWQIWEIDAEGKNARQVTPGEHPDVENYDSCYLPDGQIIFASTRAFHGVPCVGGGNTVANFCVMDRKTKKIRQMCFDQEHNWCPTVLNNGRVLYSRWEYTDSAHYFDRLLFSMNPDGTNQAEYYGSNSYWPNSMFYARPVPGHPTKVVAIVSGHHGVPRMGEMVVLDPAVSRHEAAGVVQRIPGWNKEVSPIIRDQLVNSSWPRFLHPYPLSEKYFLVSCQPTSKSHWGVYLVDVFDNMLLLAEKPGYALLEPVPFRETARPPVIPNKVRPGERDATIYMADVYVGPGLAGVPRGTIKKMRVYEYHYAYPHMGGHINIGIDGPWDVKRILGTVPVHEDGSMIFTAPANTPLAVQPLDDEGKAVQVMRSWMTAQPGEFLTCVGCHEKQNTSPPSKATMASRKAPDAIAPWYGPARGFSFKREVQPVLNRHCVGCHNGQPRSDSAALPDFSDTGRGWRGFTKSYIALHPYVRRPGPESDYRLQKPYEWHADTSELVQMLRKGHKGVKLGSEAWDRIITWIDLNVPDHGTWSEHRKIAGNFHKRRIEMRTLYGNRPEDPEAIPDTTCDLGPFVKPAPLPAVASGPGVSGWPFDAREAKRRQGAGGRPAATAVDLGGGLKLDLVLVPRGSFVMGDPEGEPDEKPVARADVRSAFYLGRLEVTNEQFGRFDPSHDTAYMHWFNKDQNRRGEQMNRPKQPVARVSQVQALAFCEWLSGKTGKRFRLPTETEWEWSCRAGTSSAMSYGACSVNFGAYGNLADRSINNLTRNDSPKWIPSVDGVGDGATATCDVGRYKPNAWGLQDMHGNVAEWTSTVYRPYGAGAAASSGVVVRGGSFYDRPKRARSAFRTRYFVHQAVYNVGFRVVCEID